MFNEKMQAIYLEGGTLCARDIARPCPAAGELLIEVGASGVNHADILQVEGRYPAPENIPAIPGLEVAGVVVEVGAEAYAKGWRTGMHSCALLNEGGYARYAVADAGLSLPLPQDYPLPQATALPEALLTAWLALIEIGKLRADETVLIHGGASGLGVIAAQAAHHVGAAVLTTASSPFKRDFCLSQGHRVLDCSSPQQLLESAAELAGKIDVVLDILGGAFIAANIKLLRKGGRLISVACMAGSHAEVSVGAVLMKNIQWQGMTLRSLPTDRKIALMAHMRDAWWDAVLHHDIVPHIHATFPLENAADAHALMQARQHCGKIILT